MAIVPLEVAVGADRPFEPAKAVVVQVLAVVMAAAWLARRLSTPVLGATDPEGAVPRRAFVASTAALAVVAAAGTALSLSPAVSLAGSSARAQGLLTLAAVWIIAVLTATELRGQHQVSRLLQVATVAAVPVAAVALLQRHGIDAIPVDRTSLPGSTFGNPLLLAGWLVTVAPLVAARLGTLLAGENARPDRRDRRRHAAAAAIATATAAIWWTAPLPGAVATAAGAAALWALEHRRARHTPLGSVAAVQAAALGIVLAAVVAAAERGPMVGLAAGAVVATLAAAGAGGRRGRLLRAGSAGVLAVVAVLAVVTLRAGDRAEDPSDAIGAAVALDRGTFAVRDRLWAAGEAALEAAQPLPGADGDDRHDAWRPVVGYGPDVTDAVLGQYAEPALWRLEGRDAPPDRAHNGILDAVLQFGWTGGAAFAAVFVIAVAAAMRRLGMLSTGKAHAVAAALLAAGAAGGAAVGAVAGRGGWWAPAAGLGLVAAIAVALAMLTRSPPPARTAVLVTAGCAGALAAHWVELQGGVETVASMTAWWVVAAVLVAPWRARRPGAGGGTDAAGTPGRADALAVVTGLVAGTALHAGSHGSPAATASAVAVTTAIGTVLAAPPTSRRLLRAVAVTLATAAAVAVPAATLAHRGERGAPLALGLAASVRVLVVVGMLLAVGAALGAAARSAPPPGRDGAWRTGVAAVALGGTLVLLLVGVGPAVAALWRGTGAIALGPSEAYRWTARADRLDPSLHATVASAAAALRAAGAAPPEERGELFARARDSLVSAARASPFSADETISLADLHVAAADHAVVAAEARAHLAEAARLYAVAANLRPGAAGPLALEALARTDLAALQGAEGTAQAARASALSPLAEAARLDPSFALVPAVRARLAPAWQASVAHAVDALASIRKAWARRDRYDRSAASVAQDALTAARATAEAAGEERDFVAALSAAAARRPSVEAYVLLARGEAALGNRAGAVSAVEKGRTLVAPGDRLADAALDGVMADLGPAAGLSSPPPARPAGAPGRRPAA